jgi:succinate dehydrogenase / fumarate reductase flavoprotein subunit
MMQSLVGIVRREDEMLKAAEGLEQLKRRASQVGVTGGREYNPGWHTALDLGNLLTVSEASIHCALARKESRGGHFREDCPEKKAEFGSFNFVLDRKPDGSMGLGRATYPPMPAELQAIVEEMK